MQVETYLFFNGRCEEALTFYREKLGAEITFLMRFKESPDPAACSAGEGNGEKIMHANLRVGGSTIMASDGNCEGTPSFQGFALSLAVTEMAEAKRLFSALSDDGVIQMPLAKTFWSPGFGMVTDRFGVSWMVNLLEE